MNGVAMLVELEPDEIDALLEGLDYLKTKISYTKGDSYATKTAKLLKAEALEQKLRRADMSGGGTADEARPA
jgi:hypothetical protein